MVDNLVEHTNTGFSHFPTPLAAVNFEYKIWRGPIYSYGGHVVSFWSRAAGQNYKMLLNIKLNDVDMDLDVSESVGTKNGGRISLSGRGK